MRRKWFPVLIRRRVFVVFLLIIQISFLYHLVVDGSRSSQVVNWILTVASSAAALYIVSKRDKGAYKIAWLFLMLRFPLFGGLLYLLLNYQSSTKRFSQSLQHAAEKASGLYALPGSVYDDAIHKFPEQTSQIRYLEKYVGFPVYSNSNTRYLTPGESMFEALTKDLENAEHYIFLEYFTIEEGVMWDSILEILKRKTQQGVLVRVIYDDVGCFLALPQSYPRQLKQFGIECTVFNPFKPFLTAKQNNRDHRKIAVIDGKVAFTGGINLADEYINAIEKHGHWKDSAIRIEGHAAWSFTLMFLQMWELCKNTDEDYAVYYPWKDGNCQVSDDGFVQPYADSPLDHENVGEHVYIQIINQAKDYVYINTPYLIIDDSLISALCLSAKSGVDIRIITPHRWDRWLVHMTTRSYYRELIRAGVKVYEYSDGFIHAKTFVSDDTTATVGTTNLDFRSLYLHFECGVRLCDSSAVKEIKTDFLNTLPVCHEITEQECSSNILMRLLQDILRLFAPLL